MSAVADKLREARALIARRGGWAKGIFSNVRYGKPCSYCADGALLQVAGFDDDYGNIVAPFLAAIGASEEPEIWAWNDTPSRRKAEVLAAFDKAIELAERDQIGAGK